MASTKTIHTIILDSGPILRNEPPVSTLLAQSEALYTVPSVIAEIRDAAARSRLENTLLPFLVLRSPGPESIKVVTNFARRTGDLSVLSGADLQILALAYELECERNGGNWRLRADPGQKGLNGVPPTKAEASSFETTGCVSRSSSEPDNGAGVSSNVVVQSSSENANPAGDQIESTEETDPSGILVSSLKETQIVDGLGFDPRSSENTRDVQDSTSDSDDPSSEGWITPSNIKTHQAKYIQNPGSPSPETTMQVATITTDFAMQNVLLQMNLNLLSPSLQRIRHLRTYILRCHACFQQTKVMDKQFCPRCGKPTLTRVACSTQQNGEFKLHLKKNMQWNTRGDRYSIPKPVPGSANGKISPGTGGGKGGWGQGLILAEDQKEYVQALRDQGRRKERNLMDEDYLPSILTGDRNRHGGRPKVGAGKSVNSRKR